MAYSHYGKQAEVWKHGPLCEILVAQRPAVYIETNAAYASYTLQHTPEQAYGIYYFLEKGACHPAKDSLYFQLEQRAVAANQYIGSPGLALSLCGEQSRYIFFDLDSDALDSVQTFAESRQLASLITLQHRDSIAGMHELLPHLPSDTFIHIDPYAIDEPNASGMTYLDVFEEAVGRGMKCFLWYGYQTLREKEKLERAIQAHCQPRKKGVFSCHALTMKVIEQDAQPCAPGVLGSGLLTGNLSEISRGAIGKYADWLTAFYGGACYRGWNGELYKEVML